MMKTMTAVLGRFTKFDATVSYNALCLPLVGAGCVQRLPRQVEADTTYIPFTAPLFPVMARHSGLHGGNNGESDKPRKQIVCYCTTNCATYLKR